MKNLAQPHTKKLIDRGKRSKTLSEVSHPVRMSGEFESRKDSHSTELE